MAFLNFAAIEPHRADILMKNAFFGLKAPYEFLSGAKKRLEDPDNLPNVAWTAEDAPYEKNPQHSNGRKGKKPGKKSDGFWVRLHKSGGDELSEAELRLFTDPEVERVAWIEKQQTRNGSERPTFREIDVLEHDPDAGRCARTAINCASSSTRSRRFRTSRILPIAHCYDCCSRKPLPPGLPTCLCRSPSGWS